MDNQYSDSAMFECLQCAEGCESCEDDRPCVVSLNWVMRTAILILSCVIICCLPVVVLFTWKYGNVKVGPIIHISLLETCNSDQITC